MAPTAIASAPFNQRLETPETLEAMWQRAEPAIVPQSIDSTHLLCRVDDILLREHSRDNSPLVLREGLTVEEMFAIAQTHFDALKAFGMKVVSFAQEPATDEDYDDITLGHSASIFIPNSVSVDKLDIRPDEPQLMQDVQIPLQKYLQWLKSTRQPYYLGDVFADRQYSYSEELGAIFLHDIDPCVSEENPVFYHDLPLADGDMLIDSAK